MNLRVMALVAWCGLFACSGGERDASVASEDASADAGEPDSGVVWVPCGETECVGHEAYCLVEPNGPCEERSPCATVEEVCQTGGALGCTPARSHTCTDLLAGCASCPCVIGSSPCGAQVLNVICSGSPSRGVTATCPFP